MRVIISLRLNSRNIMSLDMKNMILAQQPIYLFNGMAAC